LSLNLPIEYRRPSRLVGRTKMATAGNYQRHGRQIAKRSTFDC
jgi:hypothetical protein